MLQFKHVFFQLQFKDSFKIRSHNLFVVNFGIKHRYYTEGILQFRISILLKDLMQGKLIAVVYTSSLWAEFVNKSRCMQGSFSIQGG